MSPSTTNPTKLFTADEFWEFVNRPENANRIFELIRGRVVEMSRPTRPHGRVCMRVGYHLELYAERVRSGYVATDDAGVVLREDPDSVVGPDVAYYTDANTFDELHPKWGEVAPVLVAEISSPNDKPGKVNAKIEEYLNTGVKVVWLVDYEERNVTVYRPNQTLLVVREGGTLSGGPDMPGLSVEVADLFRMPGDRHATTTPPTPPAA